MRLHPAHFLLAIAALCFAGLGFWQLDRAAQRRGEIDRITDRAQLPLLESIEPVAKIADLQYRGVRLQGEFEPGWRLLLDNRVRNGQAGYQVFEVFRTAGGSETQRVLVDRGWVAAGRDRRSLPQVNSEPGMLTLEGRIDTVPSKPPFAGERPQGDQAGVWNYLDVAEVERETGWALPPLLVRQSGGATDLVRDDALPESKEGMHIGYAIQWFAFALTALGTLLVLWWRARGVNDDDR